LKKLTLTYWKTLL